MKPEFFWTAAALGAKTLGQVLLTLAAITCLTPQMAGLWFVFVSLGSVVQFFDMGLASAVLRSASHLQAGVKKLQSHGVTVLGHMEGPNREGLGTLFVTTRFIYNLLCVCVVILGTAVAFFCLPREVDATGRLSWFFYLLAVVLQLLVSQRYNFLQGVGQLCRAQQLQVWGTLLSFGAAALTLAVGRDLLWTCVVFCVGCAAQLLIYARELTPYTHERLEWGLLRALWPNSWRAGFSRLSYALLYHLPTLVISHTLGVIAAGQYGFTVQICLFVTALAQLPVTAIIPKINELAAHGNLVELSRVFFGKLRAMFGLFVFLGITLAAIGPWGLLLIHSKTSLLPLSLLAPLIVFFILENQRNNHALLVGAFNHFPFWKYDLASGFAALGGSLFIIPWAGLPGLILWLWLVEAAWNFWWPVRLGLKMLNVRWRDYSQTILEV